MAGDYDFLANPGENMIARTAQLAQTQNAVNQNKLFQGQAAASEALRQSIDPQSGQIDFANVNRLLQRGPPNPYASCNPRTAYILSPGTTSNLAMTVNTCRQ